MAFLPLMVLITLGPSPASAANESLYENQLVRRVVIFPMKVEKGFETLAEDAWWQAREELTKTRRFLVASRQFLVKNDALQARGELEPADALILGKLLDAHALITLQLNDRKLSMQVYDTVSGFVLYQKQVNLQSSQTIADQLSSFVRRLVADFLAVIPYEGYTMVDSFVGRAVFKENDANLAYVDFGAGSGIQVGDVVQWIKIKSTSFSPVFQGGAQQTVIADGKVVRIEDGLAVTEILRANNLKDIREYSLVRVPRIAEKLLAENTIKETQKTTLTPELIAPEANPELRAAKERRPLLTTLGFIGSIAGYLLLAF
jgi:hypothetical protein